MKNIISNNINILKDNKVNSIYVGGITPKDKGVIYGIRKIAKQQTNKINLSYSNVILKDFAWTTQYLRFNNTSELRWIIHPSTIPLLYKIETHCYDVSTNTICAIRVIQSSQILTNLDEDGDISKHSINRTHILLVNLTKIHWDINKDTLYYLDNACAEIFNINI